MQTYPRADPGHQPLEMADNGRRELVDNGPHDVDDFS